MGTSTTRFGRTSSARVTRILSLVCKVYADGLALSNTVGLIARLGAPCAAILMTPGFFLSVASPDARKPNGLIGQVYAGALLLAVSMILLGVLLVRSS
jgi:hypothetical protein